MNQVGFSFESLTSLPEHVRVIASASSFNKNSRKRRLPILVMAWNLGSKIRI